MRIIYGQTDILLDAHPKGDQVILAEGICEVPRSNLKMKFPYAAVVRYKKDNVDRITCNSLYSIDSPSAAYYTTGCIVHGTVFMHTMHSCLN